MPNIQQHPFQRAFCVLFISLAMLFYYMRTKKGGWQKTNFNPEYSNYNSTLTNDDFLANFGDIGNLSDLNRREMFDVPKFLNSILHLANETDESLEKYELDKEIYILGLFELTTKLGKQKHGEAELTAAKMAVRHVNALNVLPGYKLVLLVNDTQCDPGVAIDRFFHAIYSEHTILMLLGAGCSNVSEALAHVVPYWNIIQVSHGSTSPTLSDRRKFPLFFRTVAPDSTHNIAKVHFIKRHAWHVVAAFSQSENQFLLPINHLITELEKENVTCVSTVTFSSDNYREQLGELKKLDVRIIIGSFSVEMAPIVFCEAYRLKMYGSEYVWIIENQDDIWWTATITECDSFELLQAIEGVVMIGDFNVPLYHNNSFDVMKSLNMSLFGLSKYAKQSYDAIWAMALTLGANNIGLLENFDYGNKNVAYTFFDTMKRIEFVGLSGPLKFKGADRVGDFMVKRIQGGEIVNIALYDSIGEALRFNCTSCKPIMWKNGRVPIAQRIFKTTLVTIPEGLFYMITSMATLGILCSFAFLYFNLKFRQMKTVKLSSPNLNNLTVIGCLLVYLSVILFGIHNISADAKVYFNELCLARIYLLSAGFSLTFGSMLAKSYRVHHLFKYSVASLLKNKLLKDQQLIALILVPLVIDMVIVGLWITIDPLKRTLHSLVLEINLKDPGVVYQPQVELCQSHNTTGWHVALFGYKIIILIMGAYMAWRTRNVKIPALNDSQYVGICIYTTVFSTIIVIVFSFVTHFFVLSYVAKSASILASTTITLVLMFVPKVKSIFGTVDTELSIMESMGLKVQYNTRRFICEDPKELLERLEIQNRVYRSELESLDREIVRLEGILRESNSSSNKSSVNVVETSPEIHFLSVPRASWPTNRQSIKAFASDNGLNKVKNNDKSNFFGKLKKFFGSLASLQYSYNNLNEKPKSSSGNDVKPRSNPEIRF